jgi:menaquinone-dependent protoporphyrinogen oxidase
MRVLIAFASQQGSTRGIAEAIGARLRAAGHATDVRPAAEVADPVSYDVVVLGSAIHNGSWLEEASAFARRHRGVLAERPVWLFTVGSFGSDRLWPLGAIAERQPKDIDALRQALRPRGFRAFAGVVDWGQTPVVARTLFRALGVRFGDARNWGDVDAWTDGIARQLSVGQAAVAGTAPAR